ncbi:hypothetical protein UA08_07541 [Talaromyces atroroseus]|uniref:Pyrroline-5-carboxylate reductase n=1 Tax=Talaromyces atroroseus TaxID=1441469 RepID=A0A225AGV3_TALAT|nr:hypothetical protein UA08_07541 [Talaromyces atroroseus]OKL57354.1 hypothetical protein UA08_07541 [Talaromyces atroroseus]
MRAGSTLAIIGCGQIGTTILEVLLTTLSHPCSNHQHHTLPMLAMKLKPSRFIACVNTEKSVSRLRTQFGHFSRSIYPNIQISQGRVAEAVQQADIILLTCRAGQAADILTDPSLREHLAGKLLLSTCADLSVQQIEQLIYSDAAAEGSEEETRCFIVQAMPNTAASVRQSATLISETIAGADTTLPPDLQNLTTWIFSSIGTVTYVPETMVTSASMVSGLAPAFYTVALEGIAKEAMARGLSEPDALLLAAQAMKGTAEMVLSKKEENKGLFAADEVRDRAVASSTGSGAKGVVLLRQAAVKGSFAAAMGQGMERKDAGEYTYSNW